MLIQAHFYKNLNPQVKIAGLLLTMLIGAGFTGIANAQDTLTLSLNEAVNRSLAQNADIRSAKLDIRKSKNRLDEAQGGFLPSIDLNGNYTRNLKLPVFFLPEGGGFPGGGGSNVLKVGSKNAYQMSAQASLPLYNRQLIQRNKVAKSSVALSKQQLEANRNKIESRVKQTYFAALLAHSSLDVVQQSYANARSNYQNIKSRNKQGLAPDYDVLRAKVQMQNIKPDVQDARNRYQSTLNRLKLLSGISIQKPIDIEGDLSAYYKAFPKDKLADYSLKQNPQLKQLSLQKNLQNKRISTEQSAYYPNLSGVANYNLQAQEDNFDFSNYDWVETAGAGLRVQVPIFSGLTRNNKVQQAKIERQKIDIQKQNLKRSLKVEVENSLDQIRQIEEQIEAQQQNIQQAKRGFKIAQTSYKRGTINIVELNDAELALSRARMNYLTAIHDYLTALVNYEQIVNKNLITY